MVASVISPRDPIRPISRHIKYGGTGTHMTSVADPGPGAILTPGSGMGKNQDPDPGSDLG